MRAPARLSPTRSCAPPGRPAGSSNADDPTYFAGCCPRRLRRTVTYPTPSPPIRIARTHNIVMPPRVEGGRQERCPADLLGERRVRRCAALRFGDPDLKTVSIGQPQ